MRKKSELEIYAKQEWDLGRRGLAFKHLAFDWSAGYNAGLESQKKKIQELKKQIKELTTMIKMANQIKERPILFSGAMVRAILEGRKTQTRRVIPDQPKIDPQTGDWLWVDTDEMQRVRPIAEYIDLKSAHCRYGKPGDRIWVRETWRLKSHNLPIGTKYEYRATDSEFVPDDLRWKPSIHMPRAASRIMLEITDVRVERLWDISEEDAKFEGVANVSDGYENYANNNLPYPTAKASFFSLWQKINGPDSAAENPWIWAITFKRIDP